MSAKVLLLLAHPAYERARVTPALAEAAAAAPGVTSHDLYEAYPDFLIDVEAEQARLLEHDVLALQFPLFWYSVPALLKEWMDLVLAHGFAYGRGGTRLAGKTLVCGLSTGAQAEAYGEGGGNLHTVEEFLRPLQATARLCGMHWAAPTVVHGAAVLSDASLAEASRAWAGRLARFSAEGKAEAA